jgi:excisionase family DNA binding protein
MTAHTEEKILLSANEVAQLLGIAPWTVHALVKRRELPHVRLGKRVLFPRRELEAFLAEQAQASLAQDEPPRLGKVG